MRTFCGLALVLACSRSAAPTLPETLPPAPPKELPGLVWITPEQPFQLHTATTAAVFDGATLVLAGRHGWIARFDPATHRIVQERRIGDMAIQRLLKLRDGRLFVIGGSNGRVVAFTLDAQSFAPTEVKLKPTSAYSFPYASAEVLDDGRVAISGYGFALRLYDPTTWAVDKELDPSPEWDYLQARGGKLYAEHRSEMHRFDPVTGTHTKVARGWRMAASTHLVANALNTVTAGYSIEIFSGENVRSIPIVGHVQAITLDHAGVRLAVLANTNLEIRDVASGKLEHTIDLGARAWLTGVLKFDAGGRRLLVTSGSTVRVVDVATGAITPAGGPPDGGVRQLAVANDGTVLGQGMEQYRLVDGKVTATIPGDYWRMFKSATGEVTRYATSVEKGHIGSMEVRVTLHSLDPTTVRTWNLTQQPTHGWLASNGNVAIEARGDGTLPHQLLRSEGERLVPIITLGENALVYDIDLDSGFALVGIDGALHVVRVSDAKLEPRLLRLPFCNQDGDAELERRGSRVVAYYADQVIVWDRTTGSILGAARFAGGHAVAQVIPVKGRDEVIVVAGRQSRLWSVDTGVVRTLETPSDHVVGLSPDGRRLAIAFASGRIALVDLAAMRAALPISRVDRIKAPKPCEARDPFAPEVVPDTHSGPSNQP